MKTLRPYQLEAMQDCLSELRASDDPVLLMASVGAGKSLIIGELLMRLQINGKRALCLVNNAELVRNNAQTFKEQGGNPSIYCASLGEADVSGAVVFATPQSVLNGIKRQDDISYIKFNIIVIDEAHAINYQDHKTVFMRVLRHYKQEYQAMRVLGATGTPFRYKGDPIVGDYCLFKKQVGNITTAWLIENNYLIRPTFEIDPDLEIDFSQVKLNSMGKFDNKQLEAVIDSNHRLTGEILARLQIIMQAQNRFGCFIFCSTIKHCQEAYAALPPEQTAIITGSTSQVDRIEILDKARAGEIKYLINVQVLTVGIDVPGYDTLLFLRPSESLVLVVQMIGRVLRLYPNKQNALILDCAGNIERHENWDDPVLLDALKQTRDADKPLIFPCPVCETMNTEYARRCVGLVDNKRCDFYFEFKECNGCQEKNDLVARECRNCGQELIDPNAKLSSAPLTIELYDAKVLQATYQIKETGKYTAVSAIYKTLIEDKPTIVTEFFTPTASEKAKFVFYGKFVKLHCDDPSYWYPHLQNTLYLNQIIYHVKTPSTLKIKKVDDKWIIHKKLFTHHAVTDNFQ